MTISWLPSQNSLLNNKPKWYSLDLFYQGQMVPEHSTCRCLFPLKQREQFYQEQLGIRGFVQYVTEICYPPHQKMICIKTICGSMQQWDMDVILPSRKSMRFQWCKRRQADPRKGDLQMMLATVASHRGKSGDRTLCISPWAKLLADQWSWMPMLKVSWRCWEPRSRKCFLDFVSRKGHKDVAVATGILQTVLRQCISSGPGEESWVGTNLLTASCRGVLSFPSQAPAPQQLPENPCPLPKAITSPHPPWAEIPWPLI